MKRISLIVSILLLTTYSLNAFAQRRGVPRVAGDTRPEPTVHQSGPKLAETDLYELYEYYLRDPKEGCFNSPSSDTAAISLVFKVNANYVITDNEAYKRIFEKEILPVIKRPCNSVTKIRISNYIKGVRIGYRDLKEYGYDDEIPSKGRRRSIGGGERELNSIQVLIDTQGRLSYQKNGPVSLAELRKERAARETAENESQERIHQQEIEKQKQSEREEAARQQKRAVESKGGKEPTSEDLAMALARLAIPSCRNLEYQKLCEASPSFYIEVKEGIKLSCQPVVVGKNYICEYRVRFECYIPSSSGDLTASPFHCLAFPTRTYKTGALKTSDGWVVYPLDNDKR